jgi:aryl-alcohol dehydrogenase-like predicted oxidoreductase
MQYRKLGDSGLKVSVTGLGCNNFGMTINQNQTTQVVEAALDHGITLFDTADVYGEKGKSEKFLGRALGKKRQNVIIATKFGNPMDTNPLNQGASRRHIIQSVEQSLKRLGTDYIDLYQIHRPDPDTPIAETLGTLNELIQTGKIRYIGCSNFNSWQLVEAFWLAQTNGNNAFISAQNRYSLLTRDIELDLLPAAEKYNTGILPFFPLESGLLTGKYNQKIAPKKGTRWHFWKNRTAMANTFWSREKFSRLEKILPVCEKFNHSVLELAFSWLLRKKQVSSVIAGATKPSQIKQNVQASVFKISEEEEKLINQITAIKPTKLF